MELSGDEKRIQALFSELLLEDQSLVPRFEKLWLRAEATARVPAPGIMRPVAVIVTAIVLAAVGLIAASSWSRSSQSQDMVNIPAQTIPVTSVPRPEQFLSAERKTVPRRRLVRQRQTKRVTTEAKSRLVPRTCTPATCRWRLPGSSSSKATGTNGILLSSCICRARFWPVRPAPRMTTLRRRVSFFGFRRADVRASHRTASIPPSANVPESTGTLRGTG